MPGPYYEPGKYRARIVAQGFGEAAKKKTPYFFLTILPLAQIVSEQEYPVVAEYERTITRYLTDKTIDWVLDDLDSLGFTGTKFAELDPDHEGYHSFRDVEIVAVCEHRPYETTNEETAEVTKRVSEDWTLFREANTTTHDPLPAKGLQKLDALFGQELKQRARERKPSNTPVVAQPAPEPPPSISQEEIDAEAGGDGLPF